MNALLSRLMLSAVLCTAVCARADGAPLAVPDAVSQGKQYTGKRITLNFQDIDVRTVLQILAQESGYNIVAADNVKGKITLSLKNVPWDQALDLVLNARNLDVRKQGNILTVAPRAELLARDKTVLQTRKELDELGPLVSETFRLKYKSAEAFKQILNLQHGQTAEGKTANGLLSSRGSVLVDTGSNTLIVNDSEQVLRKFRKLVQELDVPARQVMVEARIVEAADGVSRDIGVKFGYAGRRDNVSVGSNMENAYKVATGDFNLNPNINLPVAAASSSIGLVRSLYSGALGLELSAMEQESRTKTISSPRVLTQDQHEAEIKQGFQVPYQTRSRNGEYSTAFKDAALQLKVTPRITPDNQVILDIMIHKDDVDRSLTNLNGEPAITTKQVRTQAMIEDGGTLVIGGVYQESFAHIVRKVPLLGDIPVLGHLFKSRDKNQSRNELLFFITPRIVDDYASQPYRAVSLPDAVGE